MTKKTSFLKSYGFILFMLAGIIGGCVVGALNPVIKDASGEVISKGATVLEPIGTVFINLMFCVVVPMVFCSIASAIANMSSAKRAGKVMGITICTFLVTAAIAAVIMYVIVRCIPIVTGDYTVVEGEVGSTLSITDMIINFFTKPDFCELWSRKAILPLIIAAIFFGFGIQMTGGKDSMVAKFLDNLTAVLMNVVKIITYYAPIGFFGFFAYLVATYGPELIGDYSRTLIIYYVMCFAYMFVFFPIYARFGGAIIKVAFLFGIFGMDFGTGQAILAIIVAVFSSVAMSGIPGGGGTGELVLCTLFFPDQLAVAFPIALAIGNLVDPPATMVNAAGDYVVSYIVERFANGKDWLQKKLAKDAAKEIEA